MGKKPTLGEEVELTGPSLGDEVELSITPPPDPFASAPPAGSGQGPKLTPWLSGAISRAQTPSTSQAAPVGGPSAPSSQGGGLEFPIKVEQPVITPDMGYRGMDAQYETPKQLIERTVGTPEAREMFREEARVDSLYQKEFQPLDATKLEEKRKQNQIAKAAIPSMEGAFVANLERLKAEGQALSEQKAIIEGMNPTNPEYAQKLSEYNRRISAHNKEGQALSEQRSAIESMDPSSPSYAQKLDEYNQRVGMFNKEGQAISQQKASMDSLDPSNPSYAQNLTEYNKRVAMFNREQRAIELEAAVVSDAAKKAMLDEFLINKRDYEIKSKKGNMPAAMGYLALNVIGKELSGGLEALGKVVPTDQQILEFLGLAEEGAGEKSMQAWEKYLEDVETSPTRLTGIDRFVTPEYIERKKQDSLFSEGLLTIAEMTPALAAGIFAGTPGMAASFFTSSYRDVGREMQGEYWEQIPEAEKEAIKIGTAFVSAGLSTMGMQALAGKIPIVNDIFFRAAKQFTGNMSAGQVRRIIDAETKSYVANLLSRTSQGFVLEGIEETLDYTQEEAIKHFYEEYKRSQFGDQADTLFQNAETMTELMDGAKKSFLLGGFVGSMIGGSMAAVSSIGARKRLNDKEFDAFKKLLDSKALRSDIEPIMAAQVEAGEMSQSDFDKLTEDLDAAEKAMKLIPDGMKLKATREAFDLLLEKQRLSAKDKSLVGDRITAIDEKLAALAGVKEEAPKKEPSTPDTPAPTVEFEGGVVEPKTKGEDGAQTRTDAKGRTTTATPVVETKKDGSEVVRFDTKRDGKELTGSGWTYDSLDDFLAAHPEVSEEIDIEQLRESDQDLGITRIVVTEHRFDPKTGKGGVSVNVITKLGAMDWELRAHGLSPWSKQTPKPQATPTPPAPKEAVAEEGPKPKDQSYRQYVKETIDRADDASVEEIGVDGVAVRYIASGGRLDKNDIMRQTGMKEGDLAKKRWLWMKGKGGKANFTIDQLAHSMWENGPEQFTTEDYRNAIIDALLSLDSKDAAIDRLREMLPKTEEEMMAEYHRQYDPSVLRAAELTGVDQQAIQDNYDTAENAFDNMTDAEKQVLFDELEQLNNEEAEQGAPVKGKDGDRTTRVQDVQEAEAKSKAEDEWDAEYKRLSKAADDAQKEFQKVVEDFNKKGQDLFPPKGDEGMFGDTRQFDQDVYDKAISEAKAKHDKATKARNDFRDTFDKWTDRRAKEILSQTRVDAPAPKEIQAEKTTIQPSQKEDDIPVSKAGKAFSSASRFRPRKRVEFDVPIKGPSGAMLKAYEWQYEFEEYVDERGENRVRRVSNWDMAELSDETGRDIVHQFEVVDAKGNGGLVSAESALKIMGYLDQNSSVKSKMSAAKALAGLLMQRQVVKEEVARQNTIKDEVDAMPLPKIIKEDRDSKKYLGDYEKDNRKYAVDQVWKMGDASVIVSFLSSNPYLKEELAEREKSLINAWKNKRMSERGVSPYDNAERKLREIEKKIATKERQLGAKATDVAPTPKAPEGEKKTAPKKPIATKEPTPQEAKPISDKAKAIADKLRQGKLGGKGLKSTVPGFEQAWDTAIEAAAVAIELTGDAAQAISDAIKAFKNTDWYKSATKAERDKREVEVSDYVADIAAELEDEKPKKPEPKEEKEPKRPMRGTAKRAIEQYPDLAKAFTDDTIYYDRLPMAVTRDEAKALVAELGIDRAAKAVLDTKNDIALPTRIMMGRMALKAYKDDGRIPDAVTFAEEFFTMGTELGQAINAFRDVHEEFSKEMFFEKALRTVKEQRQEQDRAHEKRTKKLATGLKKINKEAAEEVVTNRRVRRSTDEAGRVKVRQEPTPRPPRYGTTNKVFTQDKYRDAMKAIRGKLMSGVPPELVVIAGYHIEAGSRSFAAVADSLTKQLGKKILPYLKEAYLKASESLGIEVSTEAEIDEYMAKANTDALIARIQKAINKGDNEAAAQGIAELQLISKEFDTWGLYREYAVKRLKRMTAKEIQEDIQTKDELREFANGLVRNISSQLREEAAEAGKPPTEPKKAKSASELIAEAYKNPEKYADAWSQAQERVREQFAEDPDALERLDAYFGEFSPKPFSKKLIERSVKDGLKALDQKISDIIRKHYTVQEAVKRSLVDKLVNDAGLEQAEASALAKEVSEEFDRLVAQKKQDLIRSLFTVREKTTQKKKVKGVEDQLITLTNLGAFTDAEVIKAYGDKMGFATLTEENVRELERLADMIQSRPEGRPRFDAIEDMLYFQANLQGISKKKLAQSIWYANMLSGYQTQQVNIVANMTRLAMEYGVASAQALAKGNIKDPLFLAEGIINTFKKAWYESGATFRTGYSPIRGKVEVPADLERANFKGVAKVFAGHKYVRRFMTAADVINFELAKEMRAYQMAVSMARGEAKLDPSIDIRQRALDIVGQNDQVIEAARIQADQEYENEVNEILGLDGIPQKERERQLKKAERDRKRRVFELVEKSRPQEVIDEAAWFGARSTYNYQPTGLLGVGNTALDYAIGKIPSLAYLVPFRRVIANVANDAIDYTLWGFVRAAKGGETALGFGSRKLSPNPEVAARQLAQMKADALTKAIIGQALMTTAFLISQAGDDDEEPLVEITANGYGDWRKNQSLDELGWQQYSFKIRGTDTWVSYQYSPLILVFGLVGHYRDAEKYRKEKINDAFYTKFATAFSRNITTFSDLSFLSSVGSLLNTIINSGNEKKIEDAVSSLKRTAKTFVVPNLYTQAFKQYQEIFDVPNKDVRGTLVGDLLRDIPVARDRYQDALNGLGEPIIPHTGRFLESVQRDPVWEMFADKGYALVSPHPNSLVVYDPELGKDRVFTEQERADYYKLRGQIIKDDVQADMEYLQSLDPKDFAKEMSSITARATTEAKWELVLDEKAP